MKDITSRPTNYAVLELFLKRVYQSKKVDFFPLFMQALSKGDKRTMRLLVKYQTNINVTGKKPPLVLMAEQENNDMIRFLLEVGANPNLAYSGQYLIHRAVANRHVLITRVLLNAGASPNSVDDQGNTPLLTALQFRKLDLAQYLLQKGAKVNVANNRQQTPLDVALSKGLRKIAARMRGAGALTSVELGSAGSLRVQLVNAVQK